MTILMSKNDAPEDFVRNYPIYLAFYLCLLYVAISVTFFIVR